MSDIHALSGAYAIDALDDIERARFERHLADCAECRAEAESLCEAASMLPETTSVPAPAALRGRVLAEIATVRPLPPLTTSTGDHRRRFRPAALVAAAAAVVALAGGVTAWSPWEDSTSQAPTLSAVQQVLAADDAETYTKDVEGATVTVVRSRSLNRAVFKTSGLADLPADKVYEMWFAHAGDGMVKAGLIEGTDGTFLMEGDAADAVGAGLTVEDAGGAESPTLPAVTTFSFENA